MTLATRNGRQTAVVPRPFPRFVMVAAAAVVAAALSLAIEIAQGFTDARQASLADVAANALGGLLGAVAAGLSAGAVARGIAGLRSGGGDAAKPVAALVIAAYALLSLFPFDPIVGFAQLRAKLDEGRIAALLAPASCGSAVSCAGRLALEAVGAGLLAVAVDRVAPLGRGLLRWAVVGATIGLGFESAQALLASGIAQGASVLARMVGFVAAGWLVSKLRDRGFGVARRHALVLAAATLLVAVAAVLAVNRIHPPLTWPSPSLAVQIGAINWLPFGYVIEVSEARAAQSLAAQFAAYSLLGAGVWLASLRSGRPRIAAGVVLAVLVATAAEAVKLFMPGRHPDPTDILVAALACGVAMTLLDRVFGNAAATPTAAVEGAATASSRPAAEPLHVAGPVPLRPPASARPPDRSSIVARALAGALLAAALAAAASLPRLGLLAAAVVVVASVAVARSRDAWLVLLPLLLPALDLTHWTGRLFWTEFDSACAAMLAVLWWRNGVAGRMRWRQLPASSIWLALGLWTVAGAVAAGWPFASSEGAQLDSYFSPYVGFLACKGVGWALLFYPFAARAWADDEDRAQRLFAAGMAGGLAATTLFIVWERYQFSGLFNLAHEYRVTGPFSAMHVGGAYVEGYLIGALPFAAYLTLRAGPGARGLAAAALLAAGTYALLVTHSREAYLALAAAASAFVLPLVPAVVRGRRRGLGQIATAAAVAIILAAGAITLGKGETIQGRFATIAADLGTRIEHWTRAIRILDANALRWAAGIGPGHFASVYYWQPDATEIPGRIVAVSDGKDSFVRLGSGSSIFLSQHVDVVGARNYTFTARVRAQRTPASFTFPLCEKWLLDSAECVWTTVPIEGPPEQWVDVRQELDTSGLAHAARWRGRPVKLSLYNPNPETSLDVTAVSLRDAAGRELVGNGNFAARTDFWFYTTDSHLAWHVKNLPLHLLVEQGVVGLVLFVVVLARGAVGAARSAASGDLFAATLLSSMAGMMTVGLADSLIDAPRIATLLFVVIGLGLLSGAARGGRLRPSGP